MSAVTVELGGGVARVRFTSPGAGRAALDAVLAAIPKADVVHLVATMAEGRVLEHAGPPRWIVDCRVPERPEQFRAWSPDAPARVHYGPRGDLLAAGQALSSALLAPYEGRAEVPPWIADLRRAQVALLAQIG